MSLLLAERPASQDSHSRPTPRPPRTAEQAALVKVRNRRTEYLERHPSYYNLDKHELADPLLYDAWIRRFQSATEREAEGRAKGYSRTLEASLLRGEERLDRLARATTDAAAEAEASGPGAVVEDAESGSGLPQSQEEGRRRWQEFLRDRFVRGEDEDFDYSGVDSNDDYDVLERRDQEDAWFEDEDPGWASEEGSRRRPANGSADESSGRRLSGETGIQDY